MADKILELAAKEFSDIRNLEGNMQTLKRRIKLLNSRKADVWTTLQRAELYSGKKRKREVKDWFKNVEEKTRHFKNLGQQVQQTRLYNIVSRRRLARQVGSVSEEVEDLVEQGRFPEGLLIDALTVDKAEMRLVTSRVKWVVFEHNLEKIRSFMMDDGVSSIGIHGMGGIGKTSLAMHIHDILLYEPRFSGRVYWITVSQEFSSYRLQGDIARHLSIDISCENDEKKRAGRIFQEFLKSKSFVLIFDDVWNHFDVDKIGIPLGMNHCKLLMTSRSVGVCQKIGCQKLIKVEALSDTEAWELFQVKYSRAKLAPEIEEIARNITKRCGGLPLGIITKARSMRGVTDIHEWKNVLVEMEASSMCVQSIENEVLPVLLCSFKQLGNLKLQQFFLYCALYPESCNIRRDELIRRFISEDLMDRRRNRQEQYDQGHAILNKLENVCLLESYRDALGNTCVKMHNLMRDMALWIARENPKFMVKAGTRMEQIPFPEDWVEDLEKVSLMENNIRDIPQTASPNCPNLLTLFLSWNPLFSIPDSFFARMYSLQTLDLSHTSILNLPNSLKNLENLKALLLAGCFKLRSLPSLRKLKELRELDLSHTRLKEEIAGMESLTNLNSLNLYAVTWEVINSKSLIRLSNLQRLVLYEKQITAAHVQGLVQLEEFQGVFRDLPDFYLFINTQERIYNYDIVVGHGFFTKEALGICRRVSLDNCGVTEIGSEDQVMLPRDIKMLRCGNCVQMECILRLSSPVSKREDESHHWLPLESVEELNLSWLPNFIGLVKFEENRGVQMPPPPPPPPDTFSRLKELRISYCKRIKVLLPWSLVDNFKNLEVLKIRSCQRMEEIIGECPFEDKRNVFTIERVQNLPKLRQLSLSYLPELQRISKAIVIFDSIQNIEITHCDKLKKLFIFNGQPTREVVSHPPTLKEICVSSERGKEWWDSLQWDHYSHHENILRKFMKFCYLHRRCKLDHL